MWHLGNSAVKMLVKFQSDTIITACERWGYITSTYGIQYLKGATFTLGVAPMKYLIAQGHRALPVVSNESVNPINPQTPINTSSKELILISTWNRQADYDMTWHKCINVKFRKSIKVLFGKCTWNYDVSKRTQVNKYTTGHILFIVFG